MKQLNLIIMSIVALFLMSSCGTTKRVNRLENRGFIESELVDYSLKYLKVPYKYGGVLPTTGFDCSGFVKYVYEHFGYQIPRSTSEQMDYFLRIKPRKISVGDVAFFRGKSKKNGVGHVGIITKIYSENNFDFIHSSTSKGVMVSNISNIYFAQRLIMFGRVPPDRNKYTNQAKYYVVKKGDTLYSISRKYGVSIDSIKKHNRIEKDRIKAGERLLISF